MTETLFSYGTLRLRDVQLANYARELDGERDALVGYRVADLVVADPNIVSLSGSAVHPIARHTGDPADRVEGMRFELSEAKIAATDDYEVEPYRRVEVTLESGRTAWPYVGPPLC